MTDPISDMLTRIRNAQSAEHKSVAMPLSKIKVKIAGILKAEKYIDDFSAKGGFASGGKKSGKGTEKILEITLKYPAVISKIRRISKPGQRFYVKSDKIKAVKNGYGISVVSTSKGLMTDKEAKKAGLGGEVLLEIY